MRFTGSPVVELPVAGAVLSFEQDNNSFQVGTSVWPCSLVLVKFAERWLPGNSEYPNPYASLLYFHGIRAIELGAGCGPAGLGFCMLGLSDLILTDIPPVLPALRRNFRRNRSLLPGRMPRLAQLYWEKRDQILALNPPFDLVIAADVVYMTNAALHLVDAMEALVAPKGAVLLGYQVRCEDADPVFWDKCRRVFPVIEKVPREHLHPDYAYQEADVYVLRKEPASS